MIGLFRIVVVLLGLSVLSACSNEFRTFYPDGIAAETSRNWRVSDVNVSVPETLEISEARTIVPRADIVWREDPPGDRRAQVAAIVAEGARRGAAGLNGNRPVVLDLTVSRFHALTFEAESRLRFSGVHNVDFTATVRDARSGEVLFGPTLIESALPALVGPKAAEARANGITQKSAIIDHLQATIAGWLGAGPDVRESFMRIGA